VSSAYRDNFKYPRLYSLNAMTQTTDNVWTEPFTPNDEIGSRTNELCVRCKECGLTTLEGTQDDVVHKRGCEHRGA